MKVLSVIYVAMAMSLLAGSGNNVLDYVPPQAAIVQYGNTEVFFQSKLGKILKQNKLLSNTILTQLQLDLFFNGLPDVSGKWCFWTFPQSAKADRTSSLITFSADPNSITREIHSAGGVVIFKKNIAENIFNQALKHATKLGVKINTGEKNDVQFFEICPRKNEVTLAMALVDDDEIHITIGQGNRIWKAVKEDNVIAASINPDCMMALATDGKNWKKLFKQSGFIFDVSQVGIAKVEAYLSDNDVKIRADIDISNIK